MNKGINQTTDVIAFGAHPDDVELAAGGTVAKLILEGKKVVIVDMTKGELGTRGTDEIRLKEAQASAKILGVETRINLELPDGLLKENDESVLKTIEILRRFRPKAVIMTPSFDRHPDHEAANRIVRTAMFKSGLVKIETQLNGELQERFRIRKMYCFMMSYDFVKRSDFYVDITETFETKMNAIKSYTSQVYVPGVSDPGGLVTRLSRPEFIDELEARAIYFGTQIGVRYAEPFYTVEPLGIESLSKLL